MSEDSKAKPPAKLILSRDLKASAQQKDASTTPNIEPQQQSPAKPTAESSPTAPPKLRLTPKSTQTAKATPPPPLPLPTPSSTTGTTTPAKLKLTPKARPQAPASGPAKVSTPPTEVTAPAPVPNPVPNPAPDDLSDPSSELAPASPPPAVTAPPEKKLEFDPKNPFGKKLKDNEVKKTASTPQQEPQTAPAAKKEDEDNATKIEDAINLLHSAESESVTKQSMRASIAVILLLLLIIAAAAYGLWKVLQIPTEPQATTAPQAEITPTPANDSEITTTTQTSSTPSTAAVAPATESPNTVIPDTTSTSTAKTPIQRAKAAIAKVPVTDIDTLTAEDPAPAQVKVIRVPATPSQISTNSATTSGSKASSKSAPTIAVVPKHLVEESKQKVSSYLQSIHIDGLRQGQRPMVIINGSRYEVGDTVHSPTKLKFTGIRKGRLMFRDHHGIVYLKSF